MAKLKKIAGEVTGVSILARQGARIKRAGEELAKNVSELRKVARNAPPQFKRPTSGRGHDLDSALNTVPPLVAMAVLLLCVGGLVYLKAPFVGPFLGIFIVLTGIWCFFLASVFLVGWWKTRHASHKESAREG